ncbi:MAG: HD domain-containing protein [Nitrospiraceae bacterium]|nr:HD domain-containing protein [Nitrospiraceae bacterium]
MSLLHSWFTTGLTSIRFKVTFFVAALLTTVTVAFYLITMNIMYRHLLEEVIKRAESLSRSIAVSAGYSFISSDILGLDHVIYEVGKRNTDIDYIAIADISMKVVVHSDMKQTGKTFTPASGKVIRESDNGTVATAAGNRQERIEIISPIIFMGKRLGSVILGVNRSVLMTAGADARKKLLAVLVFILLAGISGSIVLSSFLTRPIKELSSGVSAMKEGKSPALRVYSSDELGRLTASFNDMSSLITEQQTNLKHYAAALEESYISMIRVVSAALDARDPYTRGHSERVSIISLAIAHRLGLKKEELDELEIACLLHDVGKIKTPDAILRKSCALTPEEYREMMRHAEYGADILGKAPSLARLIPPVRHHHEWHDGRGYPAGLSGREIPLFAEIISVADAFDAITSDRPYRTSRSEREALAELRTFSGTQFNPELVNILSGIMEGGGEYDIRRLLA